MGEKDNFERPGRLSDINVDRPGRGWLTDSNRNYLTNPSEYSGSSKRQHRYQIRQNFQSALMDFGLLWELDDHDLIRALKPLSVPFDIDEIHEDAVDLDPSLADVDLDDIDDEEAAIGYEMFNGLQDLLAVFAYWYGPARAGTLLEQAVNKAAAYDSLHQGIESPLYEVSLTQVDMDEYLDDHMP